MLIKKSSAVFVVLLIFLFNFILVVGAQSSELVLEMERHWDTYEIGGTCIPGSHNFIVADVDQDGVLEIVTGGFSYFIENDTRTTALAPLMIWSWNGEELDLEASEKWGGSIWCVYAGDADGDGKSEVLTSGGVYDESGAVSALKFWNWDGSNLNLRGSYSNISIASVCIENIDLDNSPEIITVSRSLNTSESSAHLNIWRWNGTDLSALASVAWMGSNASRANSVQAGDLDGDGSVELVTGGYDYGLKNSSGQLRVWRWTGEDLSLLNSENWCMIPNVFAEDVAGNPMGNTIVNNVKIGDVDGDGVNEIVTGGFTFNETDVMAQLRIWNFSSGILNLEDSWEWATEDITELKSISLRDVDGDGRMDIVTSGVTAGRGAFLENATIKELAQLRIWNWDGQQLSLKQSKDWIVGEGVAAWNLGTGDLDNDGSVEIVTVGCMYIQTLCDPDLRIWSLKETESLPTVTPLPTSSPVPAATASNLPTIIIGIIAAVIVAILIIYIRLKKR